MTWKVSAREDVGQVGPDDIGVGVETDEFVRIGLPILLGEEFVAVAPEIEKRGSRNFGALENFPKIGCGMVAICRLTKPVGRGMTGGGVQDGAPVSVAGFRHHGRRGFIVLAIWICETQDRLLKNILKLLASIEDLGTPFGDRNLERPGVRDRVVGDGEPFVNGHQLTGREARDIFALLIPPGRGA